jgi:molecular chaperone GrpE (heat shock protein)
MNISKTIIEELQRYNNINNYISEQEADVTADTPLPGAEVTPEVPGGAETPPVTPPAEQAEPTPVDVESDPEVEKVGEEEENQTEEMEITDLVKSQQNIETKQEEYFNNLFSQLSNLEKKLSDMDNVMSKLNELEAKIEKYRPKTNQEKLELRSLDSGPFNQKLTDFFTDKQGDIEKSGKNEYVLTTDEVEDYSVDEIKRTFNNYGGEEEFKPIKY